MKNNAIITLSLTLSLLLHTGCSDSGEDNLPLTNANVLSESSVLSGQMPSLAENQIMILSLESPGSAAVAGDTSEIGVDCFTIKTTQDISNAIISFDENLSVSHSVITHKSSGDANTIYKSDANKTHAFKAGEEYEYCVHHSGATSDEELFFVRFELPKESMTRASDASVQELKNSKSCVGCDFSNYDFTSSSIISLAGMNLTGANLSNAAFGSLDLGSANFAQANLRGASMSGNSMVGTTFDDAQIDSGFLNNVIPSNISHASFKNLNLSGTDFTTMNLAAGTSNTSYEGVNFNGANLSGANFSNASLLACYFQFANLSSADFTSANINTCFFDAADFTNATLNGATFIANYMLGVNMQGANTETASFNGVFLVPFIETGRGEDTVYMTLFPTKRYAIDPTDANQNNPNFDAYWVEDTQHSSTTPMTYGEATEYCENLDLQGYSSWRLPTYEEVLYFVTDVDGQWTQPQIVPLFKNVSQSGFYWSSTLTDGMPGGRNLFTGEVDGFDFNSKNYVKCVLEIPAISF